MKTWFIYRSAFRLHILERIFFILLLRRGMRRCSCHENHTFLILLPLLKAHPQFRSTWLVPEDLFAPPSLPGLKYQLVSTLPKYQILTKIYISSNSLRQLSSSILYRADINNFKCYSIDGWMQLIDFCPSSYSRSSTHLPLSGTLLPLLFTLYFFCLLSSLRRWHSRWLARVRGLNTLSSFWSPTISLAFSSVEPSGWVAYIINLF